MRLKLKNLYILLFFSVSSVFAQSNSEWKPIGLTVSGKNIQNGIEAFYQLYVCNNENVIFIKFINHNNYDVTVEWKDAVFTKELKWVSNENIIKSLIIKADEVIFGDCSGKSQKELIVKVNDFIMNIDDFNQFKTTSFQVKTNN